MLFRKFGQHNDDWKSVDMCKDHSWFKAHVNKGKTLCYKHSTVKLMLKVKKNTVDLNEKQTNLGIDETEFGKKKHFITLLFSMKGFVSLLQKPHNTNIKYII